MLSSAEIVRCSASPCVMTSVPVPPSSTASNPRTSRDSVFTDPDPWTTWAGPMLISHPEATAALRVSPSKARRTRITRILPISGGAPPERRRLRTGAGPTSWAPADSLCGRGRPLWRQPGGDRLGAEPGQDDGTQRAGAAEKDNQAADEGDVEHKRRQDAA